MNGCQARCAKPSAHGYPLGSAGSGFNRESVWCHQRLQWHSVSASSFPNMIQHQHNNDSSKCSSVRSNQQGHTPTTYAAYVCSCVNGCIGFRWFDRMRGRGWGVGGLVSCTAARLLDSRAEFPNAARPHGTNTCRCSPAPHVPIPHTHRPKALRRPWVARLPVRGRTGWLQHALLFFVGGLWMGGGWGAAGWVVGDGGVARLLLYYGLPMRRRSLLETAGITCILHWGQRVQCSCVGRVLLFKSVRNISVRFGPCCVHEVETMCCGRRLLESNHACQGACR